MRDPKRVAILISGVVSVTLTPMLCSRFLRVKHGGHGFLYRAGLERTAILDIVHQMFREAVHGFERLLRMRNLLVERHGIGIAVPGDQAGIRRRSRRDRGGRDDTGGSDGAEAVRGYCPAVQVHEDVLAEAAQLVDVILRGDRKSL